MPIDIFEIETFELPDEDNTIIEIVPLKTDDTDLLLEFMDLAKKVDVLKVKEAKGRKKTKGIPKEVDKSLEFTFKDLAPLADKIIDKGTRIKGEYEEIKVEEEIEGKKITRTERIPKPFPYEYRNLTNRIQLSQKIMESTFGNTGELETSPLPQEPQDKSKE